VKKAPAVPKEAAPTFEGFDAPAAPGDTGMQTDEAA
jgi:hypothetical protein